MICPKCGSENVKIDREKLGEVKTKKGNQTLRRTIGLCKDCGYTFEIVNNKREKRSFNWKLLLWILGWIIIFPLPLTLILQKKENMQSGVKYGIIAAAWIVYLAIAIFGGKGAADTPTQVQAVMSTLV